MGARIAELRSARSLSVRSLAACADLDISHLQRIERGRGNPTLMTLLQIAIALDVEVGALVHGADRGALPAGRHPYASALHPQRRRLR
ncbi:helix-turn-helix domain-containing protein [Microbacterium gilvum]|uniref:HTH cro/C1-type domain-containing protein n=1 Tax=Microbacterium gilvum TaxID=1336204 RepID=A0ABP9A0Z3_9MICO